MKIVSGRYSLCWTCETIGYDDCQHIIYNALVCWACLQTDLDHQAGLKVRDVAAKLVRWIGQHEHPSQVGPPEALLCVVRIEIGVGVAVMYSVAATPPLDGALHRTRASKTEEDAHREGRAVSTMCPQAMIAGCNAQTCKTFE